MCVCGQCLGVHVHIWMYARMDARRDLARIRIPQGVSSPPPAALSLFGKTRGSLGTQSFMELHPRVERPMLSTTTRRSLSVTLQQDPKLILHRMVGTFRNSVLAVAM